MPQQREAMQWVHDLEGFQPTGQTTLMLKRALGQKNEVVVGKDAELRRFQLTNGQFETEKCNDAPDPTKS